MDITNGKYGNASTEYRGLLIIVSVSYSFQLISSEIETTKYMLSSSRIMTEVY